MRHDTPLRLFSCGYPFKRCSDVFQPSQARLTNLAPGAGATTDDGRQAMDEPRWSMGADETTLTQPLPAARLSSTPSPGS